MDDTKYVFIVPYDKTTDIENGFTYQKHNKSIWSKYNDVGEYVDKSVADKCTGLQQIVPAIIIRNSEGKYLSMTYKDDKKEIISICFGDSITPIDGTSQPLFKGTVRTLMSDVLINELRPLKHVGVVRDMDKMPNYLGFVFLIDDIDEDVALLNDTLTKNWLTKDDLIEKYGKLDIWTKHITNHLVDNSL